MNFAILVFLNILINAGIGAIIPIMPVFFKEYGISTIGLSVPFFCLVLGRIICKIGVGRIGLNSYKLPLAIFFALYTLSFIAYPMSKSLASFSALRFIEGCIEGATTVILTDLAIAMSQKSNRGYYMGIFGSSFGVGMLFGLLVGSLTYKIFGTIESVFIANTCLGLSGVILALIPKYTATVKALQKVTIKDVIPFAPYYSVAILRRIVIFSFSIMLPIYILETFGVENFYTYFLIVALALTLLNPVSGRISDKFNNPVMIVIGCIVMFGSNLAIYITDDYSTFITAFVVYVIAFGFVLPSGMRYFSNRISDSQHRIGILGYCGSLTEFVTLFMAVIVPYLMGVDIKFVWLMLMGFTVVAVVPFLSKIRENESVKS